MDVLLKNQSLQQNQQNPQISPQPYPNMQQQFQRRPGFQNPQGFPYMYPHQIPQQHMTQMQQSPFQNPQNFGGFFNKRCFYNKQNKIQEICKCPHIINLEEI
jgi:hypothetical protein